jgi:hypothetical protein
MTTDTKHETPETASAHSPRPWKSRHGGFTYYEVFDATGYRVCNLLDRREVNAANALLIAVAPELLEALIGLVELVPEPQLVSMGFDSPPEPATEYDHNLGYQLFLARTAIAKAKGLAA